MLFGLRLPREEAFAVLIAVPKEKIYDSAVESIDDILSSLVADEMMAYSVDQEMRLILHASKEALIGKNVIELGLPEEALSDGYRDFFTMDGISWYGKCEKLDSALYFYAAKQSSIYESVAEQSVTAAAAAFILPKHCLKRWKMYTSRGLRCRPMKSTARKSADCGIPDGCPIAVKSMRHFKMRWAACWTPGRWS